MIAFATPWALLGLVAATLPLLLHLIQRHQAPERIFPAVRYLEDATRQQQRRLQFRHWLLLMVRTLLILALVFAAAGLTVRRTTYGAHAASALVVVLDNGATSTAVVDGEPALSGLVRAAQRVLARATLSDRLWLITADGIARAGTAAELEQRLGAMHAEPVWVDLGRAIDAAGALLRGVDRPGSVVVVSALPRSELRPASHAAPMLVLRPAGPPPTNHGVVRLDAGLQPWTTGGGQLSVTIVSNDTVPLPVTLAVGGRTLRDVLVTPGLPSVQRIPALAPGWTTITASLPPDEFRLDDARAVVLRVAPPPAVQWNPADRYLAAAASVLAADGRIRTGHDITIGDLGPGASVVLPPDDPARLGALNRALAARGSAWRFGALMTGVQRFDSGSFIPSRDSVMRRYSLEPTSAGGQVLATAGGTPWAVATGQVVLVGSRFDPAWTALPVSASFIPFLDAVLTRVSRGGVVNEDVLVGDAVTIPDRATAIRHDGVDEPVQGGESWTARAPGVFHLMAGSDTLGAITVELDPRLSDLARPTDREVRALWPRATVAGLVDGPRLAFAAGGRWDLRGLLLLVAFACAVVESLLTGRMDQRS